LSAVVRGDGASRQPPLMRGAPGSSRQTKVEARRKRQCVAPDPRRSVDGCRDCGAAIGEKHDAAAVVHLVEKAGVAFVGPPVAKKGEYRVTTRTGSGRALRGRRVEVDEAEIAGAAGSSRRSRTIDPLVGGQSAVCGTSDTKGAGC